MNRDVLDTLDSLRPERAALDEDWSRSALATILATPSERRARPTRRAGAVVASTVAVGLVGAGAAAAAGLGPQVFTDAFRHWSLVSPESEPGRQAVDPATARRVASAAGPGGTVFSVVAAPGRQGFACVALLFETPASAGAPVPSGFLDANGSQCADAPPADARFGGMGAVDVQRQPDALGLRDVRVVSIWSGPATSAVLRTAEGQSRPMVRFDGRFYGWFEGRGDDTGPTVLIGYADGAEVGRTRL